MKVSVYVGLLMIHRGGEGVPIPFDQYIQFKTATDSLPPSPL